MLCDHFKLDTEARIQNFSKGMKRQGALILALSSAKNRDIARSLETLEQVWREYDVYDSNTQEGNVYGTPLP